MFTVVYTNKYNKQFVEDFEFKTIDDAREYLTKMVTLNQTVFLN